MHPDQNGTTKFQWLRELYADVAKNGTGTSVCRASDYALTLTPEQLATFPTIEDACYTSSKAKQLYKNYWNPEAAAKFVQDLNDTGMAEMSLNHVPKRGKGQTTEFCMKNMLGTIDVATGKLNLNINYRTTEAYRAFRADLWLFHVELNKMGFVLGNINMHFDTIQCQCQTIYEVFRLNARLGEQVVSDARVVNERFFVALGKQLDKVRNPAAVLKRKKDIRAQELFKNIGVASQL